MSALDLDALERRARKGLVLSPDETLALITRLRAAEARTAWQPIETAPMDEWVAVIDGGVATTGAGSRDGEWWDRRGVRISPTAWTALPAASEAP